MGCTLSSIKLEILRDSSIYIMCKKRSVCICVYVLCRRLNGRTDFEFVRVSSGLFEIRNMGGRNLKVGFYPYRSNIKICESLESNSSANYPF